MAVPDVQLGPLREEHLSVYMGWRNSLRYAFRQYAYLTMANQRDWYEAVSRDPATEMFEILLPAHQVVGVCGLCYINWQSRHAEISIYVGDEEARGKGVARAALILLKDLAFNEFNLHRLWAEIWATNTPSTQLFEAVGFVEEGRKVDHYFWDGRYCDSIVYGLVNKHDA